MVSGFALGAGKASISATVFGSYLTAGVGLYLLRDLRRCIFLSSPLPVVIASTSPPYRSTDLRYSRSLFARFCNRRLLLLMRASFLGFTGPAALRVGSSFFAFGLDRFANRSIFTGLGGLFEAGCSGAGKAKALFFFETMNGLCTFGLTSFL